MANILLGRFFQIFLFVVLMAGISSCNNYEEVKITDVKSIKLLNFSSEGLRVETQVKITNPNNYSISVVDSEFNVYSKDNFIGLSKIENKVNLNKKSDDYHTVVFNSEYGDLAPNAASTLLKLTAFGDENINFKVDGFIEAKSFMITKRFPVSFEDNVPLELY